MTTASPIQKQALLALALLIGFYAVTLGLAGWLVSVPIRHYLATGGQSTNDWACWIGAAFLLWAVLPRPEGFEAPGPRLTPEAQPKLFALIDAVAQETGQERPAEVYTCAEIDASVGQVGGILGVGGRRVMVLGLPLLASFTVGQLRAALAHEFGHFHAGDTKLGPWLHRARWSMVRRTRVGPAPSPTATTPGFTASIRNSSPSAWWTPRRRRSITGRSRRRSS